jgi:hypothetical protein
MESEHARAVKGAFGPYIERVGVCHVTINPHNVLFV